jgi:iron complex outermembrane receptor protein
MMMGSHVSLRAALAVAVSLSALALGSGPAWAREAGQDPQTQDKQDKTANSGVAEIVVTARKRAEPLEKVPVAVTAQTGDDLTTKGIRTPIELARFVPSLSTTSAPGTPSSVRFNIRGQSSNGVLLTIDQATGLYVDGVNIARPNGTNAGFVDIDRVEVLKGPQGTLYGRNTTGGAVNIVTRGADFGGVHGSATAELGNYNDQRFAGAINLPIVQDVLAVRLAGQRYYREGFGVSRVTGQRLGEPRDQWFGRASVLFTPAKGIRSETKVELTRIRQSGDMIVARYFVPGSVGQTRVNAEAGAAGITALQQTVALGNTNFFANDSERLTRDNTDAFLLGETLTIDLSDKVQLRSITGYRHFKLDNIIDFDGSRFTVSELGTGIGGINVPQYPFAKKPDQDATFFSQELNLSGQSFGNALNWLLGAYYSNEQGEDNQNTLTAATPTAITGFFAPFVKNKSWAIYSQNDIHATDRLTFTLGARYTKENRALTTEHRTYSVAAGTYSCFPAGFPVAGAQATSAACRFSQSVEASGWSWLGSVNYQVNDNTLVYIRAAKGFRGGGPQLRAPNRAPVAPETAQDFELGLKGTFFQRHLLMNLAVYRTRYSNKQESVIVPGPPAFTFFSNAASATIKGFEAEVTAKPVAGLTLGGTLTYLDGKYDSYPNAPGVTGAATPVFDASGERFRDPSWRYSLSGRYDVNLGRVGLGVQADWSWQDKQNLSARLTDPVVPVALQRELTAPVGLLNARIDFDLRDQGVTVSLFSTNLLNKKYQLSSINEASLGIQAAITQEPRMYGVQLRARFGGD